MGLSIFFPAYNDMGTIASMIVSAMLIAEELTDDYEIIVINDGSQDFTPQILDRLAADYPRVRVVHHVQNRGYGGALRTGFESATKEWIFYTDGDAQYDVRDLRNLYPLIAPGIDMAQGYKTQRSDPWYRILIGGIYHQVVSRMFGLKVRDVDCDFRIIHRRVFDKVKLTRNSGVICVEMMKKIQDHGFKIVQAPVSHHHRVHGRSQFFRFGRIFRTGTDLLRLWGELVIRKEHLR
ncbi:MAG: glycosyltransferase family 2 protein [Anaerolineae bacterium]|jgi:glycosyltransferase involved in cell wall biosynthesis|nr:glycosyltransferase family 2 protein [Anaerolineae bacterium]